MKNILVIKHGAFGDFIMAEGAFKAIKAYHEKDHITLLTSKLFKEIAENSDYFDAVEIDDRKPFWNLCALRQLWKIFKHKSYTRIYDLQTSSRTALYYRYLKHADTEWVGAIPESKFYFPKAMHSKVHIFERHRKQLESAGLRNIPDADNQWLVKHSTVLENIKGKFAIVVTGASKGHDKKCWPIENYLKICEHLISKDLQVVLTGTSNEASKIEFIKENISQPERIISLMNQADFYDYATLSQKAMLIIGNDTGPFHLMAFSKIPAILLLSGVTNLVSAVPKWHSLSYLKEDNIADISVQKVCLLIDSKL